MNTDTKKFIINGCINLIIWFMIISFCIAFWVGIGSIIYKLIVNGGL